MANIQTTINIGVISVIVITAIVTTTFHWLLWKTQFKLEERSSYRKLYHERRVEVYEAIAKQAVICINLLPPKVNELNRIKFDEISDEYHKFGDILLENMLYPSKKIRNNSFNLNKFMLENYIRLLRNHVPYHKYEVARLTAIETALKELKVGESREVSIPGESYDVFRERYEKELIVKVTTLLKEIQKELGVKELLDAQEMVKILKVNKEMSKLR